MNAELQASWPPYEKTLATVRELSENATLRPAPRILRCIPLQEFVLKPIPIWKRQMLLIQFARLCDASAFSLQPSAL